MIEGLKPYSDYEESGLFWLGPIPGSCVSSGSRSSSAPTPSFRRIGWRERWIPWDYASTGFTSSLPLKGRTKQNACLDQTWGMLDALRVAGRWVSKSLLD